MWIMLKALKPGINKYTARVVGTLKACWKKKHLKACWVWLILVGMMA